MVQTVTQTTAIISDVIAWELGGNHHPSRENAVVAASQTLTNGMVVSLNGSGQIQAFGGVTDEVAVGVFIGDAVTTGAGVTAKAVYIARDARYVTGKLAFKSGVSSPKQAEAVATLATLSITAVRAA